LADKLNYVGLTLLRFVVDLYNKLYDKSTTHRKPTATPQQVACNNQQVLQQVAHLLVIDVFTRS